MRLWDRADGMCENVIDGVRCNRMAGEAHHIKHRGMGYKGPKELPDEAYAVWCTPCHRGHHG